MRPPLCVLLLTLLASACGGEPTRSAVDQVRFSVSSSELGSGDPLVARIENRSEEAVTLHFCHLVIQRRPESGWENDAPEPGDPPGGLCAAAPVVLLSGATHQQVAPFPDALVPGSYRLWLHIEIANADAMIVSPEFRIRS